MLVLANLTNSVPYANFNLQMFSLISRPYKTTGLLMGTPQLILCHSGISPVFLFYLLLLYKSLIYSSNLPLSL